MARKNFGDGALRLLGPSTSTGYGDAASITPSQTITAVAAAGPGTGSFAVDVGLDGVTWTTLIAASTFPVAGRTVSSTSVNLFTQVRASFTVNASTEDQTLHVAGR
jgi:hypothetical protein